jgi:hypothetical protein
MSHEEGSSEKRKRVKERVKILLLYSFKNHWLPSSISIIIFILFFILNHVRPNPYNILLYLSAILLLLPFVSDVRFYASYFNACYSVKRLLEETSDLNLEKFQRDYNELRKLLKKRIVFSGNILTYDYEISRIIHDIDTFFDATIKILFRKRVMSIPFSPHDAYYQFIEREEIQSRLYDDRWQNIEPPPSEYEFEAWEIKDVNFRTIDTFLQYFGDIVIKKPRVRTINTVAIGEIFRRWSEIIKKIDPKTFDESKRDVELYYNEKRERSGFFLTKVYELFIAMLIALITIVIGQVLL